MLGLEELMKEYLKYLQVCREVSEKYFDNLEQWTASWIVMTQMFKTNVSKPWLNSYLAFMPR
jgi:hypothetical protein